MILAYLLLCTAFAVEQVVGQAVVELADGTTLHVKPSARSAALTLAVRGNTAGAFLLTDERRGWVQGGELHARILDSCLGGAPQDWKINLRYWVRREDLLQVTTEPLDLAIAGGGRLRVGPGLPVGPEGGRFEDDQGRLTVPAGPGLRTADRWPMKRGPGGVSYGVTLAAAQSWDLSGGGTLALAAGRYIGQRTDAAAVIQTTCWDLDLPPDAPAFTAISLNDGIDGLIAGPEPISMSWRAPKATPVRWGRRGEAGLTRFEMSFPVEGAVERGGDVCFPYSGYAVASGKPKLCFEKAALQPPPGQGADRAPEAAAGGPTRD